MYVLHVPHVGFSIPQDSGAYCARSVLSGWILCDSPGGTLAQWLGCPKVGRSVPPTPNEQPTIIRPPYCIKPQSRTSGSWLLGLGNETHGNPSYAVPSNRGSAATREAVIILLPGSPFAEDVVRVTWGQLRGSCHPQPECPETFEAEGVNTFQTKRQRSGKVYHILRTSGLSH